ncbi:MAG: hypothetical protein EOR81_18500 [Mesorhizobium sp.]|nr:MAG: hypothetical protein EOR81_18500 [Mesorhizobium sp.]
MRGAPARPRQHSVQHPSSVSALRADPPSPTRGEGKRCYSSRFQFWPTRSLPKAWWRSSSASLKPAAS